MRRAILVGSVLLIGSLGLVGPAFANNGQGNGGGNGGGGSNPTTTVKCEDSVLFTIADSCQGPINGNDTLDAVQAYLGNEWEFLAKDNNGDGVDEWGNSFDEKQYFSLTGGSGTSGTWSFDIIPDDVTEFAIAIKGGPSFSLYKFDDLDTTTGAWDTKGIFKGNGDPSPGLSHFSVFIKRTPTEPPEGIPEPAAMAGLMAVGAGIVLNRRKKAEQA